MYTEKRSEMHVDDINSGFSSKKGNTYANICFVHFSVYIHVARAHTGSHTLINNKDNAWHCNSGISAAE